MYFAGKHRRCSPLSPTGRLPSVAELTLRQLIAPFLEASFGELHNVSFVHQCHGRQMMVERILAGSPHKTFRAHGKQVSLQKKRSRGSGLSSLPSRFSGIDRTFRLREYLPPTRFLHIYPPYFHGTRTCSLFPVLSPENERLDTNGPDADKHTNPEFGAKPRSKNGFHRRQGSSAALDADQIFLESLHRFIRQPRTCLVESAFARQHFFPFNPTFAAVCFLNSRVHNGLHRRSHFRSYSVSGNIRYDRHIGTDSVPSFCMVILFISIILIIWHSRQSRHGTRQSAVRCMYVALQNSLSFRLRDGERRSDSVPEQSPASR